MTTERKREETEAAQKLRDSIVVMEKSIRTLVINFAVGNSYTRHRKADEVGAAVALADLTQEERDALHLWARWLLGDVPD